MGSSDAIDGAACALGGATGVLVSACAAAMLSFKLGISDSLWCRGRIYHGPVSVAFDGCQKRFGLLLAC